jgi:prepilin signal peptidase PulO-like enzyme (type II secretory pathway)
MLREIYEFYPILGRVLFGAMFLFLGAAVGSFLGVLTSRSIAGEKWHTGRSHCNDCGHELGVRDLVPLLSQIFGGSKCRYCKAHYSWGYLGIELLMGGLFAAGVLLITDLPRLCIYLVMVSAVVTASIFDVKTGDVPDTSAIIVGVLGAVVTVVAVVKFLNDGVNLAAFDPNEYLWWEHLVGAVVISVPFFLLNRLGGMGGADVLIMFSGGLLLGWGILPAAVLGIFVGAVQGLVLKYRAGKVEYGEEIFVTPEPLETDKSGKQDEPEKRSLADYIEKEKAEAEALSTQKSGKSHVYNDDEPLLKGFEFRFMPALSAGIVISFLFGSQIIDWYMKVFMGR